MLMNPKKSVLLVIDVQAKLAPFIHDNAAVVEACVWLARVAERIGVPVVVTEHFPEKIGGTVDAVRAATTGAQYVGKQYFSAQADGQTPRMPLSPPVSPTHWKATVGQCVCRALKSACRSRVASCPPCAKPSPRADRPRV